MPACFFVCLLTKLHASLLLSLFVCLQNSMPACFFVCLFVYKTPCQLASLFVCLFTKLHASLLLFVVVSKTRQSGVGVGFFWGEGGVWGVCFSKTPCQLVSLRVFFFRFQNSMPACFLCVFFPKLYDILLLFVSKTVCQSAFVFLKLYVSLLLCF